MTPQIPTDIWLQFARWAPAANPYQPLTAENQNYHNWYLGALQGLHGLGQSDYGSEGQRGLRAVKRWMQQVKKPSVTIPPNSPLAEEVIAVGRYGFGEPDSAVAILATAARRDNDCLPVG